MVILNGDRASGKSLKAREYVRDNKNTILVVPNRNQAENIMAEERKYNPSYLFTAISWGEFIKSMKGKNTGTEYAIDELEMCFEQDGKKVSIITTTAKIDALNHKFRKGEVGNMLKKLGTKIFAEQFPNYRQSEEIV